MPPNSSRTSQRSADPGLVAIPGGRFFGFVIGGRCRPPLAADWLVSAWDQNAGSSLDDHRTTVGLERVAGQWILDMLGLPSRRVGRLSSRERRCRTSRASPWRAGRMLARLGWDVGAARRAQRAGAAARRRGAPSRLGRPRRALPRHRQRTELTSVGVGRRGADAARQPSLPRWSGIEPGHAIVCAAGRRGALRRLRSLRPELIPLARAHGAWVHVDGAFGAVGRGIPRPASSDGGRSGSPTRGRPTRTRRSTCRTTAAWRSCAIRRTRSRCSAPAATISSTPGLDPWDVEPRAVAPWAWRAGVGRAAQPRQRRGRRARRSAARERGGDGGGARRHPGHHGRQRGALHAGDVPARRR